MPSWFLSVKKGTWLRDEAVVFQIFKKEKKKGKHWRESPPINVYT